MEEELSEKDIKLCEELAEVARKQQLIGMKLHEKMVVEVLTSRGLLVVGFIGEVPMGFSYLNRRSHQNKNERFLRFRREGII